MHYQSPGWLSLSLLPIWRIKAGWRPWYRLNTPSSCTKKHKTKHSILLKHVVQISCPSSTNAIERLGERSNMWLYLHVDFYILFINNMTKCIMIFVSFWRNVCTPTYNSITSLQKDWLLKKLLWVILAILSLSTFNLWLNWGH